MPAGTIFPEGADPADWELESTVPEFKLLKDELAAIKKAGFLFTKITRNFSIRRTE